MVARGLISVESFLFFRFRVMKPVLGSLFAGEKIIPNNERNQKLIYIFFFSIRKVVSILLPHLFFRSEIWNVRRSRALVIASRFSSGEQSRFGSARRFGASAWSLLFRRTSKKKRNRQKKEEETKTIDDTLAWQSGRVLFAARPIKMPTTSPAGPLIRRHVNQSWNSTLINTGFRWSCLATYLSNDTNAIWSDTCTSVKYLSDWRM